MNFKSRHLGPSQEDQARMLKALGLTSISELIDKTVPSSIRSDRKLDLPSAKSEHDMIAEIREIASKNKIYRSFIGMGYSDCLVPHVIQRNILENPGWYTQYTPYQAEISQGRLEALLNFQTLVIDLTGLPVANASLLDEATAAAEAMSMCASLAPNQEAKAFFVSELCHPQVIEVVRTRAEPMGWEVVVGDHRAFDPKNVFGVLVQYPATQGAIYDYEPFFAKVHAAGALAAVSADIMSLLLLKAPGEFGADIAVGSTQRFGVPMGYGGPHAAYMATKDEYKRRIPGRLVGVSKDAQGKPAIRLALQTREQHIRRDKATSNICTAQVLLAIIASMYAVYHGSEGLKSIASRIHGLATRLAQALEKMGLKLAAKEFFDTLTVLLTEEQAKKVRARAEASRMNFRYFSNGSIGLSLDEASTEAELESVISVFAEALGLKKEAIPQARSALPASLERKSGYLKHEVFNKHHSETEMLRYIRRLEAKDLSLTTSMIPLGSCTMKLNATAEMIPVTWPEFGRIHPFAPLDQAQGYMRIIDDLEKMLSVLTGFDATSLQPNAGSQGEYAGLLAIREYHRSRGDGHRNVCLIPKSAHGTNPASAAMVGMKIVIVDCDSSGNIDVADLKKKCDAHKSDLSALMITYPSTHGVFEEAVKEVCEAIHAAGGQVYMDGANMNAQIGHCRPGEFGPDVCHLNLHKTFCIPHGGGGPGMGPICVKKHLAPFLPSHSVVDKGQSGKVGAVSAAPWGSPSILPIPWMYIRMMGAQGLTEATNVAILNANYIAKRLDPYYPVLYKGRQGFVAHECIVDLRQLKATTGVEVEDVAKRLMDYGFHAPTVSFPVAGTLMIEPTESEPIEELDRFCEAMIAIRKEIDEIEKGSADRKSNVLKNAPHTAQVVISDQWSYPYSREKAAYPAPWTRVHKFWPPVSRIDSVYGDRNLVCACPSTEEWQ